MGLVIVTDSCNAPVARFLGIGVRGAIGGVRRMSRRAWGSRALPADARATSAAVISRRFHFAEVDGDTARGGHCGSAGRGQRARRA